MADDPQTTNGWHPPEDPDVWREQATITPETGRRFTLPTLPASLSPTPATTGAWHLPARTDTTARPAPTGTVAPVATGPRPEDAVPAAPAPEDYMPLSPAPEDTLVATRPEDEAIAATTIPRPEDEVAGIRPEDEPVTTTAAPRPEDLDLRDTAAEVRAVRAEDISEEDLDALADDLEDALDAFEDDEGFGMSELIALQSLAGDADDGD
ncbi:MAG: hypothetical protein AAFV33_23190, partial [Chloroflexota bacterium]